MDIDWDAMMPKEDAEAVAEMLLQDFNIGDIDDSDLLQIIITDRNAVIELFSPREFPCDKAAVQEIFQHLVDEEIFQRVPDNFEGESFTEDDVVFLIQAEAQALLESTAPK